MGVSEDIQHLLMDTYQDPVAFARAFVPHWFPASKQDAEWELCPIAPLHRGILAILLRKCEFLLRYGDLEWIEENFTYVDEEGNEHKIFNLTGEDAPQMFVSKFTLIMIPRGFAKTTCANLANLHNIAFQDHRYIAYISETQPHSVQQVDTIKHELQSNDNLRVVFGDLMPKQREGKWQDQFFETRNGCAMVARGGGQQVRGMLWKQQRPTKWIMDDMESKDSVETPDRREKRREWYYGDLEPILDDLDESAAGVALATLLHPDALATYLERDHRYTVIKFGAEDKAGNDLWYKKGKEFLEDKKKAFARAQMLHVFYLEFYNQVRAPENQAFKPEYIQVFPRKTEDSVRRAIAWDPAISQSSKSDHPSISVAGMTEHGIIHFYEVEVMDRQSTVREQVDKYFELAKRWDVDPALHGIESISFQAVLIHLVQEEMFRQAWFFEPQKITHQHEKVARIKGVLQPRYRSGYITHQRRFSLYEAQLLDFPNGKLDGPDSAAMAVSLLDPAAPLATPENEDLAADQFEPIDKIIPGYWQY